MAELKGRMMQQQTLLKDAMIRLSRQLIQQQQQMQQQQQQQQAQAAALPTSEEVNMDSSKDGLKNKQAFFSYHIFYNYF